MRTRFTIITLVALILTAASSQITFAAASNDNQASSLYLQIKEAAEARQDELLYLLEEDLSQEVMANLQTALQLMQDAELSQDPQASLQLYMRALQSFRITWSSYLKQNESISLNTLTPGPEVILPEIEPEEELQEKIMKNKVNLLMKFQNRIEEEYNSLYNEIAEIMDLLVDEDFEKVQRSFEKLQAKLDHIKESISKGKIEEILESIETDLTSIEESLNDLNDKEASKALKEIQQMDRMASKIQAEKDQKAQLGQDTAEEDAKIREIKESIKEAKKEFMGNKEKTNGMSQRNIKFTNDGTSTDSSNDTIFENTSFDTVYEESNDSTSDKESDDVEEETDDAEIDEAEEIELEDDEKETDDEIEDELEKEEDWLEDELEKEADRLEDEQEKLEEIEED